MGYECGKAVDNYLWESLELSGIFRNFREWRAGYAFPPILYGLKKDLDI
jgi:hypothetical protein